MIIGCISVVKVIEFDITKLVGIEDTKGRGIIFPGGKFETYDKNYKTCAARELLEETGLVALNQKLIFHSLSGDPIYGETYIFAFLTSIKEYKPKDSKEGKVNLYNWEDFEKNCYCPYVNLLKDAYNETIDIFGAFK